MRGERAGGAAGVTNDLVELIEPVMRTFRSPSGREWLARVVFLRTPAHGQPAITDRGPADVMAKMRAVLHFQSDSLVLELQEWPTDWESLPDEALVALVRQAQPPRLGLASPTEEGARG